MWALPGPFPQTTPEGPPQEPPCVHCQLRYRPREFPDPTSSGQGQWRTSVFRSEGDRLHFVQRWQHDFEMQLPE